MHMILVWQVLDKMLNEEKTSLQITGHSRKRIPSPWTDSSAGLTGTGCKAPSRGQKQVASRFAYGSPFFDPSEPIPKLRDFQAAEGTAQSASSSDEETSDGMAGSCAADGNTVIKYLLHTSGIFKVEVCNNVDGSPYDGNDHAVINMKGKYMFTWELLQETLDLQGGARTSIKGIFRSKAKGWLRNSRHLQSVSLRDEIAEILGKSHVQDVFTDALFDYLTLLDIDYAHAFRCKCVAATDVSGQMLGSDGITLLYDNACNLLHSILKRMPSMLLHYKLFVDSLHWAGHKDCSPYFNKAMSVALHGINSQLCEQRNRAINNMRTSAAFMSQPRGLVIVR